MERQADVADAEAASALPTGTANASAANDGGVRGTAPHRLGWLAPGAETSLADAILRAVVRISRGGACEARIRFTGAYDTASLTIGAGFAAPRSVTTNRNRHPFHDAPMQETVERFEYGK
jgi:hypothetical protein